jgi:hypothetical protein
MVRPCIHSGSLVTKNIPRDKRARKSWQIVQASRSSQDALTYDAISRSVAHDIRNQCTIGYKPITPRISGIPHRAQSQARGTGKLIVRTKSGYYAGTERSIRK